MPIKIIIEFRKCSSKSIISGFRDFFSEIAENYIIFRYKLYFAWVTNVTWCHWHPLHTCHQNDGSYPISVPFILCSNLKIPSNGYQWSRTVSILGLLNFTIFTPAIPFKILSSSKWYVSRPRRIRPTKLDLGCNKREQKTEYYCNVEKILFWKYTNLNKSLNVQLQAVTYSLKLLRLKLICSRHGQGATVKLNI